MGVKVGKARWKEDDVEEEEKERTDDWRLQSLRAGDAVVPPLGPKPPLLMR